MTELSKCERVRRALWREPVDRLPTQINYTAAMGDKLARHYRLSLVELPARLDNHLLRLDISYRRRTSADGLVSFDLWGAGWSTQTEGYWHSVAPLAESFDVKGYAWPDPHGPGLLGDAAREIAANAGSQFVVPNFGLCLFERAWSLRGFDALLCDTLDKPARVEELLDRITDIQIVLAKRFIALGVDGGYFGDDYGAQCGMLFSPKQWRQMLKPRLARMFALFRNAGLPVILHSDGDIRAILPDLLDIGLTALNPVQPEVLDHRWLAREFGRQLAFYGGISTQSARPRGSTGEVRKATLTCAHELAPRSTGLLLGPSHRLQSDIPVENVDTMREAFQELSHGG